MSVNAREVRMSRLSHKSWWVVGLIASLAIVVVVVRAAIPDPSGVIHACYRSNGNLRLVDKSSCRAFLMLAVITVAIATFTAMVSVWPGP